MKHMEEYNSQLKENMKEYLANFETLPYGTAIVTSDDSATILEGNPAFYDIIGHTPQQFSNNHGNSLVSIVIDDVYDIVEKAVGEGKDYDIQWDLRVKAADGSIRWIHDFVHYDHKLDLFFITITDITDKMVTATVDLSYTAFQTRNEVLSYVSKYTSECVAVSDIETDEVVYMNPSCMKLAGLQQESQWQGKAFAEIAFGSKMNVHPDYYDTLTEEFSSREYYNEFHNLYIHVKNKLLTIPSLNRKMRLSILSDITAQKHLEQRVALLRTLQNCIRILFTTTAANDVTDAVYYDVLKQMRNYYNSDGAFFYKFTSGTMELVNIYRILGDKMQGDKAKFPIAINQNQVKLLKEISELTVEESQHAAKNHGEIYRTSLAEFHIDYNVKQFACVAVNNEKGEIIAFMGVTNPHEHKETKELMELLSHFVCMFLEHQQGLKLKEETLTLEESSKASVVEKCAKNFQNVAHVKENVCDALDALCNHYDADFAMIVYGNQDADSYGIPYIGGRIIPDLSAFQNQPSYTMDKWTETFAKHHQFVTDMDLEASAAKMVLKKQYGIYNFIVAPIQDANGTLVGLLFANNYKLRNRSHLLVNIVAKDIADYLEKVRVQEKIQFDSTAMMANKVTIQNQISQLLEKEEKGTLFVVNIDNFRKLNESLGHLAGDQVLIDLVECLRQIFRETEVIGRVGGDEFVVFSPNLMLGDVIEKKANQILTKCHHYYNKDGLAVETSTSIGICSVSTKCKTFQPLYENANYALYVAKKSGKNRYYMHSESEYSNENSMANELRFFPNVVNALKAAIQNHGFVVHYQPFYHVPSGMYTQAEALVRMRRLDGTLSYPKDFIEAAENSGLVVEMTYQILEQVCYDFRQILDKQPDTTLQSIAINLPYLQFADPNIEQRFMQILNKYDILPCQIKLEVTERIIATDMELMKHKMTRLIARGFKFELDDFGTDYSNLQMCITLPLEIIKLDRSLLLAACASDSGRLFFKHIVAGIRTTGRQIVMEGVETKEQLEWAKECNCEYIQGYYFAKPVEIEKFSKFLM